MRKIRVNGMFLICQALCQKKKKRFPYISFSPYSADTIISIWKMERLAI